MTTERRRPTPAKKAEQNRRWREKAEVSTTSCPICQLVISNESYDAHVALPHTEQCAICNCYCTPPHGGRARDLVRHRREIHADPTATYSGMDLEQRAALRTWTPAERAQIAEEARAVILATGGWVTG